MKSLIISNLVDSVLLKYKEGQEFFSNLDSFVFCSDIRTNIHSEESKTETTFGEESPSDLDILWNSAMQYNWINIKAFNKPLTETSNDNMDFFDGSHVIKFEDIKLNVIKYYSKVLSKNYYNSDDNINIDSPFTDWDTYYDMKFRQRFVPYKMLDNQTDIYNQYIVYSSYFFSDFWFKRKEEQSKIFERVDKVYLSRLINKNGLNAQVGYNKFILFLNNLTAKELASLLLDENGKYIKYNIIMDYIDRDIKNDKNADIKWGHLISQEIEMWMRTCVFQNCVIDYKNEKYKHGIVTVEEFDEIQNKLCKS
jgi:hypothetical protein